MKVLAGVALGLVLAGCSGSSEPDESTDTTEAKAPPAAGARHVTPPTTTATVAPRRIIVTNPPGTIPPIGGFGDDGAERGRIIVPNTPPGPVPGGFGE